MKYAKRMVLVPEDEYLSLKGGNTKLKAKKVTDLQKPFIKMTQDLGKDIRLRNIDRIEKATLQAPTDFNREIVQMTEHLPQTHHHKARLLLSELRAQGFKWKYNKELTTPSGQTLYGSNVIDLIKEALVQARRKVPKPTGWTEFILAVADSGIPKTLFTKKSTKQALDYTQRDIQSPSPFKTPFQTPRRLDTTGAPPILEWDEY